MLSGRSWILGLALVSAMLVLVGSLWPGGLGWSPVRPPILAHFLAYGALGAVFAVGVGGRGLRVLGVVLALAMFGLLLELIQIPIPKRSFFWGDVLANAGGALLGAGLGWLSLSILRCARGRSRRASI